MTLPARSRSKSTSSSEPLLLSTSPCNCSSTRRQALSSSPRGTSTRSTRLVEPLVVVVGFMVLTSGSSTFGGGGAGRGGGAPLAGAIHSSARSSTSCGRSERGGDRRGRRRSCGVVAAEDVEQSALTSARRPLIDLRRRNRSVEAFAIQQRLARPERVEGAALDQ